MSRIRHATEEFVNNLIRGINQLISTNTEQINVLSEQALVFKKTIPIKTNADTIIQSGIYKFTILVNVPVEYGVFEVYNTGDYMYQKATSRVTGLSVIRGGYYNGETVTEWTEWKQIATTDKTEILFPYNSGITDVNSGERSIIYKSNNIISIILNAYRESPFNTANEIVGVVPVGYRPLHRLSFVVRGTTNEFIGIEILPTGAMYVKTNGVNTTRLQGTLTYYTE